VTDESDAIAKHRLPSIIPC